MAYEIGAFNNKAPGVDKIPAEFSNATMILVQLHSICSLTHKLQRNNSASLCQQGRSLNSVSHDIYCPGGCWLSRLGTGFFFDRSKLCGPHILVEKH